MNPLARCAALAGVALAAGLLPARPAAAEAWELPGITHTIYAAAQERGVSDAFMACVMWNESKGDRHAVGDGGAAHGLWQFHPATFTRGARLAGYPDRIALDQSWREDVTVSTRAAAALMASRAPGDGPQHWGRNVQACGWRR